MIAEYEVVELAGYRVKIARMTRAQRLQVSAQTLTGPKLGQGMDDAFRLGVMEVEGYAFGGDKTTAPASTRPPVYGCMGGWTEAQLEDACNQLGDSVFGMICALANNKNYVSGTRAKNSDAPSAS